MKVLDIKKKAKDVGVNPGKMDKAEIIKAIQIAEGNFDCFGTANDGNCDQVDCCWRDDCLK